MTMRLLLLPVLITVLEFLSRLIRVEGLIVSTAPSLQTGSFRIGRTFATFNVKPLSAATRILDASDDEDDDEDEDDEDNYVTRIDYSSIAARSSSRNEPDSLPVVQNLIQALLSDGTQSVTPLTQVILQGKAELPTPTSNPLAFLSNRMVRIGINNVTATMMDCAVLGNDARSAADMNRPQPYLLLPMPQSNPWWLLQQVSRIHSDIVDTADDDDYDASKQPQRRRPFVLSRLQLLLLNSVLTNRDGGLFDNLPYTTWWTSSSSSLESSTKTKPNQRRPFVDAANNAIAAQFHPGKRQCYNRLMGQDWYRDRVVVVAPTNGGKSRVKSAASVVPPKSTPSAAADAIGSVVDQDKDDMDEVSDLDEDSDGQMNSFWNDATNDVLQQRIRQVRLREWQMDLAECDYEIAILTSTNPGVNDELDETTVVYSKEVQEQLDDWQSKRQAILNLVQEQQQQQQEQPPSTSTKAKMLIDPARDDATIYANTAAGDKESSSSTAPSLFSSWKTALINRLVPASTSTESSSSTSAKIDAANDNAFSKYACPYSMMQSILCHDMKAEVLGAVLENTSLLDGTITMGGIVVLRRLTQRQTVSILGESVQVAVNDVDSPDDDLDIASGTMILVECEADEAIGMSLARRVPLFVETNVWERGSVMCAPKESDNDNHDSDELATWKTLDPELSILTEGQASNQSLVTERALPIRISRVSTTLFDTILQSSTEQQATTRDLFPTDNPIQSLQQLDDLSLDDKARTLMGLSNFPTGQSLPRPRVLRQTPTALDTILLPLIDESVRRQYLIREALQRGDMARVAELEAATSKRGVAKLKAEQARQAGVDDVADYWEAEADLYGSLRADVTQDEGSYNRFLDRDEWYERDRQRMIQRMLNKKQ